MPSTSASSGDPAPRDVERLVFVYDADSGFMGLVADSAKKLFQLKGCALCTITHGLTGEKREWSKTKDDIGVEVDGVHRDELDDELDRVVQGRLPCVVAETTDGEKIFLLAPEVLERCKGSVNDFRARLLTYTSMHELRIPGLED